MKDLDNPVLTDMTGVQGATSEPGLELPEVPCCGSLRVGAAVFRFISKGRTGYFRANHFVSVVMREKCAFMLPGTVIGDMRRGGMELVFSG